MPLCSLVLIGGEGGLPRLRLFPPWRDCDKKKKNVGSLFVFHPSGVLVRVEDTPALSTEWSASPD